VAPDVVTSAPTEAINRSAERSARSRRAALVYGILLLALVLVVTGSLFVGQGSLSDVGLRSTLLSIRAARIGAGLLVGAALGVAGLIVQGLFRNPLADASVLGTSSGALLGGNAAVIGLEFLTKSHAIRGVPPDAVLPLGCLLGALTALSVLLALLKRTRDVLSVILSGFLLSSLFLALIGLLTSIAQERWELGRAVVSFSLGGLTGTGPFQIALAAPLVLVGIGAAWFWAKPLDLLLSGDEEAASLGVNVGQVRRYCALWTAVLTAGAVSLGGNIAFVGLLVPHALRPLLGVDHRRLLPATALGGALFIVACDLLARSIPAQYEVPLGVITGLLGAPAFLILLLRNQREVMDA
jgi:iron complex transport system permease protein